MCNIRKRSRFSIKKGLLSEILSIHQQIKRDWSQASRRNRIEIRKVVDIVNKKLGNQKFETGNKDRIQRVFFSSHISTECSSDNVSAMAEWDSLRDELRSLNLINFDFSYFEIRI